MYGLYFLPHPDLVLRIYPNEASAIRLIEALLIEQDERWTTGRKYLDMQAYCDAQAIRVDADKSVA